MFNASDDIFNDFTDDESNVNKISIEKTKETLKQFGNGFSLHFKPGGVLWKGSNSLSIDL